MTPHTIPCTRLLMMWYVLGSNGTWSEIISASRNSVSRSTYLRICQMNMNWMQYKLAYTCNEMHALESSVAYKQSRLRHSKPKTEFRLKQTKPKTEYVGAYILLSLYSLTPFLLLLIPGTETRQTCKHASDNVLAQIPLADCVWYCCSDC